MPQRIIARFSSTSTSCSSSELLKTMSDFDDEFRSDILRFRHEYKRLTLVGGEMMTTQHQSTATSQSSSSSGGGTAVGQQQRRPLMLDLFVLGFAIIIRICVGYQPHSGQDNYHGSQTAYGGDFEAQRHWMEVTTNVPIGDWYWYELEYWGLDYPPLTAYVSYLCGVGSSLLVGPESVALVSSRGIEDPTHKAYMRATVLVLDMLLFGSAVYYSTIQRDRDGALWTIVLTLCQPAILLIDHGHFQYNTVALGLAIWSFHYMTQTKFTNCIYGSILFCLALNFKQISLYYAPAVFCYLLGRCMAVPKYFVVRFLALGITVVLTFFMLWEPFLKYGPSHLQETTKVERVLQILHRIFPFQRGLYESKVANLWCALSVKPFSVRERLQEQYQLPTSLGGTLILILPACYMLFRVGIDQQGRRYYMDRDWRQLLWGTTSTALGFFLASFQVHEKSILFALAPASLLLWHDSDFVEWFSFVCVWTLWPLLQVDRIEVGYVAITMIFVCLHRFRRLFTRNSAPSTTVFTSYMELVPMASYVVMIALHVAQVFVTVPSHLPDLFPVLWSVVGCGMVCMAWLCTFWKQIELRRKRKTKVKVQ